MKQSCDVCGRRVLLLQQFGEITTALCEDCARDERIGEPELVDEALRQRRDGEGLS